jgi:hypothetical protein
LEERSFPKQDHIDYIKRRAEEEIPPELGLVDVVADTPTHKRVYLVGVKRPLGDEIHQFEIPFQVIERCEDEGSDAELRALLHNLFHQVQLDI